MKYTIILLITVLLFSSCSLCKPPRNNAEMEQRVRKHDNKRFTARQWMKERSDGYWVVTTIKWNKRTDIAFECKPTQQQLDSL